MVTVVTFNGRQSTDPSFGIAVWRRILRPILSGTRDRLLKVPGRRGVYDLGCDRDELKISCEFALSAASPLLLRQCTRSLAAWLDVPAAKELTFSDEPNMRYLARPTGAVDMEAIVNIGMGQVTFLVPAGYAEAISPTIVNGASGIYGGTLSAPMVVTLTAEAGDTLTITQGQYSSPAPFIRLLDQEFAGGETVIIDTEKRLVTVDGADARPDVDIDSDFENFVLLPGAFVISAEGGVVESIVYRERYI